MQTRVHLGPTWSIGVQEASDGRRGHLLGEEENQGKLRGLRGNNGGVLSLLPHGEVPRDIPDTGHTSRRQGRSSRNLRGVLSAYPEVDGMPDGRISSKVKHLRETMGVFHASIPEGEGGDFTGGTGTSTAV